MNWAYAIGPRMKVAGLLGIVLAMVFCKNVMDRKNVAMLGDSFSSVYEDRLLVESYIYKISDHLYQKHQLTDQYFDGKNVNSHQLNHSLYFHDAAIADLIKSYKKTKFTQAETATFKDFTKQYQLLQTKEAHVLNMAAINPTLYDGLKQSYRQLNAQLRQLSTIQIEEGTKLNQESKSIVAGSVILTTLEMALLIAIAFIIQALILATNSLMTNAPKPSLN
ncbi:MAG: MCP four helix bundle domain-containing protein [Sediminibacterium sp.]|jgi:hypothetical protein|uniref:MCP four helix bundle domain-containing protein n=1 Tax=Sediminibacterium sp. TaxID=1917865 RepID=UPI002ABB4279|nr:MCP four helix bundle domain-containing protein [Sediminibacterium sp.]MDZ4070688.1 MCP four helix bundle domain-containing protein [Sediminibacterium sp.]